MATARKPKRKVFDSQAVSQRTLRASYDIARSTTENENLWKYVDSLSAADANSPTVRKTIRERARYEVANNSYADGIVDTLAADTIGPEVQIQLGDSDLAQRTERAFEAWARAVRLWDKVRGMRRAKCVDGEAFGMFVSNPRVANRVKLDVRLIECEMIESWVSVANEREIDGIRFDEHGNPIQYRFLDYHPGDHRQYLTSRAGKWTSADFVLHYFSALRPGQVRGVSELTPALSLFGELRQFTKAVLLSAARAAEFAGVMQTTLLPENVAAELSDPLTTIEAVRNAIVSLPEGWTLQQLRPEQPATTYAMFKREIINEIARCLSIPYNIAACDSSSYNYASGRLDHQTYDRSIEVERADIRAAVLDRIYAAWLDEYAAVAGLGKPQIVELTDHEWHFAGRGHVDPNKEASADDVRLRNGTLTRARYWAKQGADWKRESGQWIKERIEMEQQWNEARDAAGLEPAPYPGDGQSVAQPQAPEPDDKPDDEGDDGDDSDRTGKGLQKWL
jgi:lambda family phage portal protein